MGKPNAQKVLKPVFLLLVLAELSAASYIAIKTSPLTGRGEYPGRYTEVQRLLSMRRTEGPADFYRTETRFLFTANDPYFYNYNGVSFFSSSVNANIKNFLGDFLLSGFYSDNFIFFNDLAPLSSAVLNMRYQIVSDRYPAGNDMFWRTVGKLDDTLLLLENKYYLPLGFMSNRELIGYHHNANPAQSQNDFFRRATGLVGDLFTVLAPQEDSTAWHYEMPSDGMLYVIVSFESDSLSAIDIVNPPHILPVGSFPKGEIISITKGNATEAEAVFFDSALFERGYSLLSGQTLNLTKFTNTAVRGGVTALKDGLLYTSIPGDKNWSAYVDGAKSEIVLIGNAMIAVRLSKGYHEIEFRYFNKSFLAGIIVSLVSLAVFVLMAFVFPRNKTTG